MDAVADYIKIIAARSQAENPKQPEDYIEDGLLHCGKCRTSKQCRPFPDKSVTVFCVCKCKEQEEARLRAIRNADEIKRNREACFGGKSDELNTFAADDAPDTDAAKAIRGYVEMPEGWLLLFGGTGTGKSFYAACICNELIDRGHRCKFTSVSEIADMVFAAEEKAAVYDDLSRYEVVVLDDLGAERNTEYMKEITFRVIDCLMRNAVSVVITTNLSVKELVQTQDTDLQRIYSRICKRAIPIPIVGGDRRVQELMTAAKSRMQKLIEGGQDELCGYTEITG